MEEYALELDSIYKNFGSTEVLKGISLQVKPGEFVTLLGSSGCGKTTTLRIIAGLEVPDSGTVTIEGKDVTNLPPNLRDVNTVFQNYALFPHMNVEKNIAYSQKIKKIPRSQIKKRVENALDLVQLPGYQKRMPNELSGGQRQRVAIARAIINRPKVLLLDEPLGALDLNLRHQMQDELKEIQKKLGITFVYITHDQEEALNMSDRIAIMKDGEFQQIGTPVDIYNYPTSSYVAQFVGSANIIKAKITGVTDGVIYFKNENGCGKVLANPDRMPSGDSITIAIRGENVSIEAPHVEGECCFPAVVRDKNFVGGSIHITLQLKDNTTIVSYHHGIDCPVAIGDHVCAQWDPARAIIVDWGDPS